jgi:hypothetical protein
LSAARDRLISKKRVTLQGSFKIVFSGTKGWIRREEHFNSEFQRCGDSETAPMQGRGNQGRAIPSFSCCEIAPKFKAPLSSGLYCIKRQGIRDSSHRGAP